MDSTITLTTPSSLANHCSHCETVFSPLEKCARVLRAFEAIRERIMSRAFDREKQNSGTEVGNRVFSLLRTEPLLLPSV